MHDTNESTKDINEQNDNYMKPSDNFIENGFDRLNSYHTSIDNGNSQGVPLDQSIGTMSGVNHEKPSNNLSAPVKHEFIKKSKIQTKDRNNRLESHRTSTHQTLRSNAPIPPTTFGRGGRGLVPEIFTEKRNSISRSSYYSASVDSKGPKIKKYKRSKKN